MSDEICYRQKRTSNAAPGGIEELVNAIGLGSHAAGQHELKDQVIETSIPMKSLLSGYKSNKISWLETSAKSDWELSL